MLSPSISLLLRYFDSTEGTITIDGVNILDLTEDSLNNIVLKYFGYTEEVKNEQV